MTLNALTGQFVRYLFVGGCAALVDLLGFVVLLNAGLALVPAAALSFTAAALLNFLLSTCWVFTVPMSRHRFLAFFGFALVGVMINTTITALAAGLVSMAPWLAKIVGIGTAFGFNFLANALIVFRIRAGDVR